MYVVLGITHLIKTVPIVFVPGVMGSHLHFTDTDKFWNPDSNGNMMLRLCVSYERCADKLYF